MYDINDSRYARQLVLRGFGPAAQEKLANARVLIVGAGGLGSPVASYLAAAGVGTMSLVDTDVVDLTNLHRQLLYATPDVGRRKVDVARERLLAINPQVVVHTHDTRLNAANAATLIAGHDVVIDATDNFPTRYAINDACLAQGIPFVYGSVARFDGQVSVFAAPGGPCYRCLFPVMPAPGTVPTCAEEGVLGVVPGIIGLHQATEAIKLLTTIGTPLVGQLLLVDLLAQDSQRIVVARRHDCPACGDARLPSPPSMSIQHLSPADVAALLTGDDAPTIIDVREQWEYDLVHLPVSTLIPLSTLASRANDLDPSRSYALLCHHGMRSEMAANWLMQHGFLRLINIDGGIDAWSMDVDSSLPRY
ncbi:HesA/MoeB/ThiF family protein [Gemmatimonas groenlandica]|uniref:Molybdopterin-synthase adenylyltransferase n=1 Tax=Gemmatimonas groenlandica TaxID=2732249 RepID=A0A6M4IPJ6_9BACT|nr:HesA/MoeB/ThiF family protein [Gemmatimonas groenlandica]QJR36663.1 HesA/MoeB/ThiF family protein [Gemmatimonas groenlandica]